MPAATVAAGWPRNVVNGHYREWLYRVSWTADADYLDIPLKVIKDIHLTDVALTACGVASITLQANNTSRVVFNSAGAITNCFVRAIGW